MKDTNRERDVGDGEQGREGIEELGEGCPFPMGPQSTEVGSVLGVKVGIEEGVSVGRVVNVWLGRGSGSARHRAGAQKVWVIKGAEIRTRDSSLVMRSAACEDSRATGTPPGLGTG